MTKSLLIGKHNEISIALSALLSNRHFLTAICQIMHLDISETRYLTTCILAASHDTLGPCQALLI